MLLSPWVFVKMLLTKTKMDLWQIVIFNDILIILIIYFILFCFEGHHFSFILVNLVFIVFFSVNK